MGSFEKPKAPVAQQEVKEAGEQKIIKKHEIEIFVPDKMHMKRHDEQEEKDRKLAAMLQANWMKVVADEHRTNH